LILLFSLVFSQCPLPGVNFVGNTFFEASFSTGFKVTVGCAGTATGITAAGGPAQAALYSDNNGQPTTRLAISSSCSSTDGISTMNFASPVQVTPGNYWIFVTGNAIIGGCLGCSAISNIQIVGLYGVDGLPESYAGVNFDSFAVGQLGYSMYLNVVTGTACEADWQCASSGANYDFATCVNGFCACGSNFAGSAIPEDVCRCDTSAGNQLAYDQNGNPNCLLPGVCQVGSLVRVDLCADYTENAMFICCNNGQCQCVDGFQGSATASDQCRCDNDLTWTANGPVCSSPPPAERSLIVNGSGSLVLNAF